MALSEVAGSEQTERDPVVNNFSIRVATKNGSGSQTANTALLRVKLTTKGKGF